MSRIGKRVLKIPEKTQVNYESGLVTVIGPKGTLSKKFPFKFKFNITNEAISLQPLKNMTNQDIMMTGTINSLINNMIVGVNEGFKKELKIIGVGYRCQKIGDKLKFQLGFSHPVEVEIPSEINIEILKQTHLILQSIDKEKLGQFCSKIRNFKKPEPYLGKGIRYIDEHVIRKESKKAGK